MVLFLPCFNTVGNEIFVYKKNFNRFKSLIGMTGEHKEYRIIGKNKNVICQWPTHNIAVCIYGNPYAFQLIKSSGL